ncbi:MAG: phosphatase PAP2 family protein [Thermoanaerobaculia bacterium]
MSTAAKRRYAAAGFVTLLILSIFWPSPLVSMNRLWWDEDLEIDELSFLGREAPSWDVVFWCIAGLLLLAILQSAESNDFRPAWQLFRSWRRPRGFGLSAAAWIVVGAAVVAFTWLVLDVRVLAWAESIRTDGVENVIRLVNRFGGGMNPALVIAFFLVAGIAYADRRWVQHAVGMAMAGLAAGLVAQVIKHLVGRARPELWLGPEHYAPGSSTSFPSGHTVGAFALAGVLVFSARSPGLRVAAFVLACAVGLSRIVSFRHWSSDVVASAILGLFAALVVVRGLRTEG